MYKHIIEIAILVYVGDNYTTHQVLSPTEDQVKALIAWISEERPVCLYYNGAGKVTVGTTLTIKQVLEKLGGD
jgi:hypothetical protein